MRPLLAFILLSLPFSCIAAAPPPKDCSDLLDAQIKLASGQWICAIHHVPIKDVKAFFRSEPRPVIEFRGKMQRISDCNPNSLYPDASVHQTKEFCVPRRTNYCPICERVMIAADIRAGAYFQKHHTYEP
jgi:hypothetical protein